LNQGFHEVNGFLNQENVMRTEPHRLGVTSVDVLVCLVILLLASTFSLAQFAGA
jgi:hypothetical protein